jgi:hypothetical protein
MTDLIVTTSMLPDVADYGFKMAATKPELAITFERLEMALCFQLLLPYFRSCQTQIRLCRQCPTTEILGDRHRNEKWRLNGIERNELATRLQRCDHAGLV